MTPVTFNEPLIVVLFDNLVVPDTFNDDKQVELFCKVVLPVTYNEPNEVLLNIDVLVAFKPFLFLKYHSSSRM